ncbi:MAG: LPS export ABC transporter periplasmic protein LptC, partial [Candidatus Omnitrophota bacterium]
MFLGFIFLSHFAFAKEADQEILQFNLAGFQENGKKSWELNSQTANIFQDTVKLSNIIAKSYANKEEMTLVADEGFYDKTKGAMHLEKNVKAVTASGATLNTNSLDWDQKKQLITTKDDVSIQKDNITAQAKGAEG